MSIVKYMGRTFPDYEIDVRGNVTRRTSAKRTYRGRRLGHRDNASGYCFAYLPIDGKYVMCRIHRIMAYTFLGDKPGDGYEVRHLDGDRSNNCLENLAWGTRSDNERDKIAHGKSLRGERHWNARITEREVRIIRQSTQATSILAKKLGITYSTVSSIRGGCSWRWIDSKGV